MEFKSAAGLCISNTVNKTSTYSSVHSQSESNNKMLLEKNAYISGKICGSSPRDYLSFLVPKGCPPCSQEFLVSGFLTQATVAGSAPHPHTRGGRCTATSEHSSFLPRVAGRTVPAGAPVASLGVPSCTDAASLDSGEAALPL